MENMKKWKFDLQVLICNPEFHNKSNFIQRSDFIAYTSLWAKYVIKYSKWKKKKKNELFISNEELNQIVIEKGLLASIKGHLCLTKQHLDYPDK